MPKKQEELGTLGKKSKPKATTTGDSPVPSASTFNSASETGSSKSGIPHSDVSRKKVTSPPGPSVSSKPSPSTVTRRRAAGITTTPTTTKRAVAKSGNYKTKTLHWDDATTFTTSTLNANTHANRATNKDISNVPPPGAVSVPGTNSISSLGSPSNELDSPSEFVDAGFANCAAPPLVVDSQLVVVTDHHAVYEQDEEDLEQRIEQEVESRLMKRGDPTLVVAEAVPPSITITCKQFCCKWKYLLVFLLLSLVGAIVAGGIIASSPKMTRDEEIQARIQSVLRGHPYLNLDEDQTSGTPQSLALQWVLSTNTSSLMPNGYLSDTVILERYGLAVLFYATNGPFWENQFNFLTESSVCRWNNESQADVVDSFSVGVLDDDLLPYDLPIDNSLPYGVYCYTNDENVQRIWLSQNGLRGTIPSELSLLSNLQSLYVEANALGQSIPTELGRLTALQGLSLADNGLHGTLPTELGHLTELRDLQAYGSNLHGTLPSELGKLTVLDYLGLASNQYTGTLPSELGQLTTLRDLQVQNNTLHGT